MPRGTDRRDHAQVARQLWTPRLLVGTGKLARWYKADDGGITYATGISSWADQSGNAEHATQGTGANQPTLSTTGWTPTGGRMAFASATGKVLNFTAVSYSGATGFSGMCAFHHNPSTGAARTLINGSGAGGSPQLRIDGANSLQLRRYNTTNLVSASSTATTDAYLAHVASFDAMTNSSAVSINGARNSTANDPAFTSGLSSLMGNTAHDLQDGGLAEVLIFPAIASERDRQLVEGYLAWKWRAMGTTNRLANSHPFKNRPPLIGD